MILCFEKEHKNIIARNSTATLSTNKYKDGKSSLFWEFENEGQLVIKENVMYKKNLNVGKDARVSVFGVYIYSDGKSNGTIKFDFLKDKVPCCSFTANINYYGWRSIFVKFDGDMQGTPQEKMNSIILTANYSGNVYIDQLVTSNQMDPRSPVASFQVPDVSKNTYNAGGNYYTFSDLYNKIPDDFNDTPVDMTLKENYIKCINDIYSKFNKSYDELLFLSNKYLLMPVEYVNQAEIFRGLKYPIMHNPISLRRYCELMFSVAISGYKDLYIRLLKHLIEEGFAAGSSMGVLHHIDYSLRMLYPSVLLMLDEIEKANLTKTVTQAMKWMSGYGVIFVLDNKNDVVTADTMNTRSQAFFIISLMSGNKSMMQLKRWLDFYLKPTIGLKGLIKEDGSIYHHCGHYTAYGLDGIRGLLPVIYATNNTDFAIDDDSWSMICKVLSNMVFYSEKMDFPISMSGRHPNGLWKMYPEVLKYWELSAINRGEKFRLDLSPCGHLTMNMACACFHRRKNWLASLKGFSKYLWGNESYLKDNLYGRYLSYGYLEILKESQEKSGFSQQGFDWAMIPGATAIHYPVEQMKAKIYNLDDKSGFEEMLISDTAFAGGVDDGRNGIFSMELHGHPKYDGSHKAFISYIMHDEFILCLGSGISNRETAYPTYTTLFQKSSKTPAKIADGVITDTYGNKYYCDGNVSLKHEIQHSFDESGKGATSGEFACGYIDHGCSPDNAEYEYGIGVYGADKAEYEVIQKDDTAHIVKFNDTVYFAIKNPESFKGAEGIKSVSHMMLIIKKPDVIYVCQPDLGLYDYDETQYDKDGNRIEVSIYSREWIGKEVKFYDVEIITDDKKITAKLKGGRIEHFEL